jgi:hypothetical protein
MQSRTPVSVSPTPDAPRRLLPWSTAGTNAAAALLAALAIGLALAPASVPELTILMARWRCTRWGSIAQTPPMTRAGSDLERATRVEEADDGEHVAQLSEE